jgi:hypothetical protein
MQQRMTGKNPAAMALGLGAAQARKDSQKDSVISERKKACQVRLGPEKT